MFRHTKNILLAIIAMQSMTACIVEDRNGDYRDHDYDSETTTTTTTTERPRTETKTTTTTTTTTTEEKEEIIVPEFSPIMASATAELLDYDDHYDSSWQAFTFNFSDVADSYACTNDMPNQSEGSVVTLSLHGFETPNEVAACPVGNYDIMPDCSLYEGEACMSIIYRDTHGHVDSQEFASSGSINIRLVYSEYVDEPHRCVVSSHVNGAPDMSFNFDMYFESYELSHYDDYSDSICTM